MNIVKFIHRINDLYGTETTPKRFDTTQWLRPGFRGAGLVDHGPVGVRQGYGEADELGPYIRKQKGKHALKSYYNFFITDRSKGKYKVLESKLLEATPENLKKLKKLRDQKVKEHFPYRISDEKFSQLRLKNKNLNNEDFAKLLTKKGYKTYQDTSWSGERVQVKQEDLRLRGKVGVSQRSPRPEAEVIEKLKKYEGGDKVVADYLKTNQSPDDLKSLRSKLNQREYYRKLMTTEEGRKLSGERSLKYRRSNIEAIKALNMRRWAQEGMFPVGTTHHEHLWRDLYRSSKSKGGERFKLYKTEMPPLKITKAGNQVRDWLGNDYYKKVKFKDLETDKIINYKNLEEYLDTTMGKGTYKKALSGYELKDTLKNQEITYKGKKSTLGGLLKQKLYTGEQISKQPLLSPLEVHHPAGVGKNWWSNEVVFRDANQKLRDLDSSLMANLKRTEGDAAKNSLLQKYAKKVEKLPGGISSVIEGKTYGTPTTAKSVLQAAGKEADLLRSKNYRQVANILSDSGIKCRLQEGLTCNDPRAYIDSINEQKQLALAGDTKALSKFNKVSKLMRGIRGAAKLTGWGILGEIGFAPIIAVPMLAKGESWSRVMNDVSYGLFGKNAQEELFAALPEGSLGAQRVKALEAGERSQRFEEGPKRGAMTGMDPEAFNLRSFQMKEAIEQDWRSAIKPFMVDGAFDQEAFERAGGDVEAAKRQIEKEKLATIQERQESGWLVGPNQKFISDRYGATGGGLANLTRTVAPDSGPMSQGLRSLYIDDMDY